MVPARRRLDRRVEDDRERERAEVDRDRRACAAPGRAFRNPTAFDLFYDDGVVGIANPNAKPEKVDTIEVDVERRIGKRMNLLTTAYGYRLRESGVPCTIVRWAGFPHGQNMFTALTPEARHCFALLIAAIRGANSDASEGSGQEVGAAVGGERLPQ